jgi:hypothetical protein
MGVGGQHLAPAVLSPGNTRYPLYRRLGGPQDRSGWVRNISPTPGFDPWIVQPEAIRNTDCTSQPTKFHSFIFITILFQLKSRIAKK